MKLFEKVVAYQKKQSENIKNNQKEITFNNWKMLNSMLVIGCFTFGTFFILSFFLATYQSLTILYGIVICFLCCYLFCTKHILKNINPIYLIYFGYGIMIAYSIYSSAFVTPDDACVIILFLLFQLPIIIVDKSWRVNMIECIFAIEYIVIAVPFKSQGLFVDEIVNCALFTGVSIILGEYMRNIKIDNYELNRQATIREKYDFLTSLGNRRNLFDKLERLKHQNNIAIIMLDVDNL